MRQGGLEPDVITYSASISAREKGQQWGLALGLLRQVPQGRLEPDVITYSASISACEKGQEWAAALGLLRQVHQRRLEPNVNANHPRQKFPDSAIVFKSSFKVAGCAKQAREKMMTPSNAFQL